MARELRERTRSESAAGAGDPDGVVSAPSRRTNSGPSILAEEGGQDDMWSCEHCPAKYRTKRGLGVHVAKAHPVEANNAVDVERVKARWSVEEVRLMARAEASATLAGDTPFMNQFLEERFPQRSLEAIKGKRRSEAYRAMVRDLCLEMQSATAASEGERAASASVSGVEAGPATIETTIARPAGR